MYKFVTFCAFVSSLVGVIGASFYFTGVEPDFHRSMVILLGTSICSLILSTMTFFRWNLYEFDKAQAERNIKAMKKGAHMAIDMLEQQHLDDYQALAREVRKNASS